MTAIDRANKRLISDTNYYAWRKRGANLGIPAELFDQIWKEAAETAGMNGVEAIKDEIRQQEAVKYGV
jgi:hypothetical protein